MHDAVNLFYTSVKYLYDDDNQLPIPNNDCMSAYNDDYGDYENVWEDGEKIIDRIEKMPDKVGFSGKILFENRKRKNFSLDIIELTRNDEFRQIATWQRPGSIVSTQSYQEVIEDEKQFWSKKLIVVSKLGEPFLMLKLVFYSNLISNSIIN